MNKLFRTSLFLVALALPSLAPAQTFLTQTTLSTAVADSQTQWITLASGTGFAVGKVGYIDREQVEFNAISILPPVTSGPMRVYVRRGAGGTTAAPHLSGALVFMGTPNQMYGAKIEPQGSCTRGNEVSPRINVVTGVLSDCVGGQWVNGIRTPTPRFRVYSPEPGGTLYSAINTNGTTLGATTLYCSETFLPTNKLLTGAAVLAGTTVGTDKWYVVLYDSAGNALANSAVAGTTTATASIYQQQAFTSKIYAVGPATYFVCFQTNGTTDTARMAVTGVNDNFLTKGQTGATFGTVPALTVPTTFTTAVGPYVYVY